MHGDHDRALPWCLAAIVVAGTLVYLNAFAGVFVYDDMREILTKIRFKPLGGGNRLICIDECQKLSSSA